MSSLDKIKSYCKKYSDSKYVFSKLFGIDNVDSVDSIGSNVAWIIIFEKFDDKKIFRSNEDRKNIVNSSRARFRANKLKVVEIFNPDNLNFDTIKLSIRTQHNSQEMDCVVGEILCCDDYDTNNENTRSSGIPYFKTIDAAYFCTAISKTYSGPGFEWTDNGELCGTGAYLKGKKNDTWIYYYDKCQKESEGTYCDDIKHGKWTYWNEIGEEESEGFYIKDEKTGVWLERYNDDLFTKIEYLENGFVKIIGMNKIQKDTEPSFERIFIGNLFIGK